MSVKTVLVALMIPLSISSFGQTPPVQPKVQSVVIPAAVTIAPPQNAQDEALNKPLTAEEAALIALKYQPDVTLARAELGVTQGKSGQARSGLLPSLTAAGNYSNTHGTLGSGLASNDYGASALVKQLIFDFDHTRNLARQAGARESSAAAGLTRVQSDVVRTVKLAFYTYQEKQRLVEVNASELANQQSHLAAAKARLDAGMGLPADVVRAETAVGNAAFNLSLANNEALIARITLAELMGIDPRTPLNATGSAEPVPPDSTLDNLVSDALDNRPEMRQAKLNQEAATYGLNASKTGNSPSVGGNAGWAGRGEDPSMDSRSLSYGLTIQWPIFDSGLTKGRVLESQSTLTAASAQAQSTRLSVISQVSQSYITLKTAEQRVTTADAQVANAEESLRLIDGRYTAGLGTFLDVLGAQTALLTARTNRVNAVSEVDRARVALVYAIGATRLP